MADVFDLYGNLNLAVNLLHTRTGDDTCVTSDPLIKTIVTAFTYGTDDGEADKVFHERRTLADGAAQTYPLAVGQTARLSETVSFATVKAIVIYSTSADNKVLTLSAGVSGLTGWLGDRETDTIDVQPGGLFVLTAPNTGYTCESFADEITVTNAAGGSSTFDIIVIGTSA